MQNQLLDKINFIFFMFLKNKLHKRRNGEPKTRAFYFSYTPNTQLVLLSFKLWMKTFFKF